MRFYYILFFGILILSSRVTFAKISTIKTGASSLNTSFESILSESYKYLPYTKNIIKSNQTYSLSMYNGKIDFNTYIDYTFNYTSKLQIRLTLIYALEEVLYYMNYINHSKNASTPVYKLQDTTLGDFLWNIDESTAYYVSKTPNSTGLLLKIQFSKNTLYNPHTEDTINQIIQKVQWDKLQKIYD